MNILSELLMAFSPERDGFVFMWILTTLGVTALGIVVERVVALSRYTNVDAELFIQKLKILIKDGKYKQARQLCDGDRSLMLARVLGAGIEKYLQTPQMIRNAMEEESLDVIPRLEKGIGLVLMFGNVSTLLGLMGTIYGLILSFAAVARPDIDPILKSSLLAQGISTAMNTTLLGLIISVPCVFMYSVLRNKVDCAISVIDRYAVAVLQLLNPGENRRTGYKVSNRRIREEVDTEPNIAPMMNLMVILIPLLLSSAEFVKIGAIELKLPQSAESSITGNPSPESKQNAKLNLGVIITEKGFDLVHYFHNDSAQGSDGIAQIPMLENGKYDYETLNRKLADVKRRALHRVLSIAHPGLDKNATLLKLFNTWSKNDYSSIKAFEDHEEVKIVAQEKIKYQVVVSVMDAARGVSTPYGTVTMFPNVSLAGGIVR